MRDTLRVLMDRSGCGSVARCCGSCGKWKQTLMEGYLVGQYWFTV